MAIRYYTPSTRAALASFCAGHCYFPGCNQPLLGRHGDRWVLALEISHIHALKDDGPRARPDLTIEQRNDFQNLIYLCTFHHKVVDARDGRDYPADMLFEWKELNESDGQRALCSPGVPVTAEYLEAQVTAALKERDAVLNDTLERLDRSGDEAATLIRELQVEIRALREVGTVDYDAVVLLSQAARDLQGLPDQAGQLKEAANQMAETIRQARQHL